MTWKLRSGKQNDKGSGTDFDRVSGRAWAQVCRDPDVPQHQRVPKVHKAVFWSRRRDIHQGVLVHHLCYGELQGLLLPALGFVFPPRALTSLTTAPLARWCTRSYQGSPAHVLLEPCLLQLKASRPRLHRRHSLRGPWAILCQRSCLSNWYCGRIGRPLGYRRSTTHQEAKEARTPPKRFLHFN